MTDEQLADALRSIGKAAFVEHFKLFRDYAAGRRTKGQCDRELGMSGRGSAWRLGSAKAIFDSGRECDALRLVACSKVPDGVRAKAQEMSRTASRSQAPQTVSILARLRRIFSRRGLTIFSAEPD